LSPPEPQNTPYNLQHPEKFDFSQYGQSKVILQLLKNMRHGFFIECGAYDGENLSNTLLFERNFSWTGLLIEPSEENFVKLKSKNRKSWLVNGCLEVLI